MYWVHFQIDVMTVMLICTYSSWSVTDTLNMASNCTCASLYIYGHQSFHLLQHSRFLKRLPIQIVIFSKYIRYRSYLHKFNKLHSNLLVFSVNGSDNCHKSSNAFSCAYCIVSVEGILQVRHHNSKLSVYVCTHIREELAWCSLLQRPVINLIHMFAYKQIPLTLKSLRPLE